MANWAKYIRENDPQAVGKEVVKRARRSIHFDNGDGSVTAFFSGAPCHYYASSQWHELDTTLVDAGSYWYAPGTRPRISKSNREVWLVDGLYSQTTSRVGLLDPSMEEFTSLWDMPAPTVDGDSVVTSKVNDYEHRITVLEDGLRETLTILRKPGLGAEPGEYLVVETVLENVTFPDGWVDEYSNSDLTFPVPSARDANGDVPECRRYAKTVGGTQYLYTGVLASWMDSAAYPVVVDPDFVGDAGDGYVYGLDANVATARSTAYTLNTSANTMTIGQRYWSNSYWIYRSYLKFDTSAIPDSTVLYSVNLKCTTSLVDPAEDFDVQIVKQDWSSQDPLSSGNMEAAYDNCLSGTADDNIWQNTASLVTATAYLSGNLSAAWVNDAGTTYYSLRSSRDYNEDTPTDEEFITVYTQDAVAESYRPVLIVVYATPSGEARYPTVTSTSSATSPYDDRDWQNSDNAKANDAAYTTCYTSAGNTGAAYPTLSPHVTVSSAPYDDTDWTDKTGLGAEDTDYASIADIDRLAYSYIIKAQKFGFSVPSDATIVGVEVKIKRRKTSNTTVNDGLVSLLDANGDVIGENKADTGTNWPLDTFGVATYGGSTDTWTASLTPSIVNDDDFGVGLAAYSGSNNSSLDVDYITVQVWYETCLNSGEYSYLLYVTDFGWAIPAGNAIDGVQVDIERHAEGTIKDAYVKLLDADGVPQGDNEADTGTSWPSSDAVAQYGSSTETWGATLTPTIVNDADFGVAIAIAATADGSTGYIDYVSMTIWYSAGGTEMPAAVGTFTLTGQAAGLIWADKFAAGMGSFTLTGQAVSFRRFKMEAWQGSYTLTGQDVGLAVGYNMVAAYGAFVLTGQDADFYSYQMPGAYGSFALTGQAAGLIADHNIVAAYGSFALTGQTADFQYLHMDVTHGSFALTGQDADFSRTYAIITVYGAFVLTGQDAAFDYYHLDAGYGAFALAGQDAALRCDEVLPAAYGSFVLTGQDVELTKAAGLTMMAGTGSFTLTGYAAGLRHFSLTAEYGSFALTGQNVALRCDEMIVAGTGSFALTGQDADFRLFRMAAGYGSFTLTGQDASFRLFRMTAGHGSFALTGQGVGLTRTYVMPAAYGAFALTGQDAGLRCYQMPAAYGSFALTGQDVSFLAGASMSAEAGEFTLTGQDVLFWAFVLIAGMGTFALTGQDVIMYGGEGGGFRYRMIDTRLI